jgi:hypothetical protein
MAKRKAERPVVVTTQYRGVFFGYANDTSGDVVSLNRARMCVYWDSSLHGVLGLACDGPNANCRIGKAVDSIELRGVTAVIECGDAAAAKWEAEPWK